MIKGALFTLGILATLGGVGMFIITIMGASMSDSPSAANEAVGEAAWPCGIAVTIGIGMIVGAIFIPK